ncbi:MAG: molybdopterin-dependent oxidoreductase [Clostridiales bacterium]|jgi:hypothetical protein|nr:molybdopterin-dependent oxidoreductase [Clostridiales bacterium]
MAKKNRKTYVFIGVTLGALLLFIMVMKVLSGGFFEGADKTIKITAFGDYAVVLEEADIRSLECETFTAVIRSSGQKPEEVTYTGIPLLSLFNGLDIDMTKASKIIVKGSDGYASAITIEEAENIRNVYIAYQLNGEDLKPKSRGGNGPYQLVILNDPFSQRWCKYVNEVEIE